METGGGAHDNLCPLVCPSYCKRISIESERGCLRMHVFSNGYRYVAFRSVRKVGSGVSLHTEWCLVVILRSTGSDGVCFWNSATQTALLFATEPVWGAVFSYLWTGERLSGLGILGGLLLFVGSLDSLLVNMTSKLSYWRSSIFFRQFDPSPCN